MSILNLTLSFYIIIIINNFILGIHMNKDDYTFEYHKKCCLHIVEEIKKTFENHYSKNINDILISIKNREISNYIKFENHVVKLQFDGGICDFFYIKNKSCFKIVKFNGNLIDLNVTFKSKTLHFDLLSEDIDYVDYNKTSSSSEILFDKWIEFTKQFKLKNSIIQF